MITQTGKYGQKIILCATIFCKQGRYRFDNGVVKCELLKSKGIAKDDTLDLSIAYIMMKYESKGYSRSGINYENNEISMCNGSKSFTVSIDASNGQYCLNSTPYANLSEVIFAINAL